LQNKKGQLALTFFEESGGYDVYQIVS